MANWTVSKDDTAPETRIGPKVYPAGGPNPRVEEPNAAVYVTWASDDPIPRTEKVRVPYDDEPALLNYLAREALRRKAEDDRNANLAIVVATVTIQKGLITLPDISDRVALQDEIDTFNRKVSAALRSKAIAEAKVIDPSIPDDPST